MCHLVYDTIDPIFMIVFICRHGYMKSTYVNHSPSNPANFLPPQKFDKIAFFNGLQLISESESLSAKMSSLE